MSSPSVKRSAIALGLFALAIYVGYMIWIAVRF